MQNKAHYCYQVEKIICGNYVSRASAATAYYGKFAENMYISSKDEVTVIFEYSLRHEFFKQKLWLKRWETFKKMVPFKVFI